MSMIDFDDLIDQYGRKVFNLAYRITGSRQDAEDVSQETFLQVFQSLDSFRGDSEIYTWIYKIAFNNCLKLKRNLSKQYVESLDEKVELYGNDIPQQVEEWYQNPEKAAYISELLSEIRSGCLHFLSFRLPENQRIAYVMRNVLDFSYEEISNITGVNTNVIKARLNRARNNLTQYFGKRCQWLTKDNTCTCKSRIGFALAYDPEILRRVNYQAMAIGLVSKEELEKVYASSIDELYRKFPMLKYNIKEALKEKIG